MVLAAIVAAAALVAGAIAILLLLVERREDDRLLGLAGAGPAVRRRGAAGMAFAFSFASILVVGEVYLLIVLAAVILGKPGSVALVLGATLLALLPVPFVLALGTGLFYRPPAIGGIGRAPARGGLRRARRAG